MLFFNIFSKRLNNLVDNANKKDVIYFCQTRNILNTQQPSTKRNKIAQKKL